MQRSCFSRDTPPAPNSQGEAEARLLLDVVRLPQGVRTEAGREAGGRWKRFRAELADVFQGRAKELRVHATLLGLPLFDVVGDGSIGRYTRVFGEPSRQDPELFEVFRTRSEPCRTIDMGVFESKGLDMDG